jgi:hypothetical protein
MTYRDPLLCRILGLPVEPVPAPEGAPTRPIKIIRGDHVEVRDVPQIVRRERPDRTGQPLPCCGGIHHRRRQKPKP